MSLRIWVEDQVQEFIKVLMVERPGKRLTEGIPESNLGKIGLAISPFDSDIIYAAIELDRKKGGVFISVNRGASWTKTI